MQFSDTSTKQGLLQDCEFWTNLGDAGITGDASLKAQFTRLLNVRYAKAIARAQLLSGKDGVEDTNYEDHQFSFFDITENVNNYQFLTDADGNTISDITGVLLQGENDDTGEGFKPLTKLHLSDADAMLIMSPNTDNTGTPTAYLEKNNTIFFDVLPDFTKESGGKLFYRLVPSYFVAGDTIKKPGFVEAFHGMLSKGASHDWLIVNKSESTTLVTRLEAELKQEEQDFADYIRQKNPTRIVMTSETSSSR